MATLVLQGTIQCVSSFGTPSHHKLVRLKATSNGSFHRLKGAFTSSSTSTSTRLAVKGVRVVAVSADHYKSVAGGGGGAAAAGEEAWDYESYQALLRGGEDVASIMKTMSELLEDIKGIDEEDESLAVEIAAAGAVGQKLDSLDGSFLLALDWMMKQADSEKDDKRKEVLQILKDAVLGQLSQKCPSQVQVIGMLCQTPKKEKRQEILRRTAGGGGVFDTESGGRLTIPKASLNDIAIQADNLLAAMEDKPSVKDRRLLAKLVLAREEARSLMGGGVLDGRNDNRGYMNLPDSEVKFLSKLVSIRPGPTLREKISSVMKGKDEGEDLPDDEEDSANQFVSKKKNQKLPVRPGMFLEALTKVLGGMYDTNTAGVGVQQLEWIHRETLKILEEMAYS